MRTITTQLPRWLGCGILLFQSSASIPAEAGEAGGWFVEAVLNDIDSPRTLGGFTIDDEEAGWSFNAGYAFNRHFSIQAGYHQLVDDQFATGCPTGQLCLVDFVTQADIDGFSVVAIGTWPVTNVIEVYGKLGAMRWDVDFAGLSFDEASEDLLYGVGVAARLSPHWQLSLQYEEVDFDLESVGLALRYAF